MTEHGVVTITLNPAIDRSFGAARVLADQKLRCTEQPPAPGGGGINVARAMVRFGAPAHAFWSRAGTRGAFLERMLDEHDGITHTPVEVAGETRENFAVVEETTGRQYRFCLPGPAWDGDAEVRWQSALASLARAPDYLVLSGSIPAGADDELYARLIAAAPHQSRVVVDTGGAPLRHAIAAGAFLIKPNLRELRDLVGSSLDNDEDIEAAAAELIAGNRAEGIVVSIGAGGAILVTTEGSERLRAPTVPIVSTIGAGDSMVAGIVAGLTRGMPLPVAVRLGVAAGAAAVKTPGTELCRADDANALFAQMSAAVARSYKK